VRDLGHEGVVGVGVRQQRADGQQHLQEGGRGEGEVRTGEAQRVRGKAQREWRVGKARGNEESHVGVESCRVPGCRRAGLVRAPQEACRVSSPHHKRNRVWAGHPSLVRASAAKAVRGWVSAQGM
jgi:hypothetical protein